MPARFIDVVVEPHEDLPDGCRVQFQAARDEEPRPVNLIRYQPAIGPGGLFRVEARARDGKPASARVATVEIRGAGTSTLIWGGDRGLRLFRATDVPPPASREESPIAAPYLLLAVDQLVS